MCHEPQETERRKTILGFQRNKQTVNLFQPHGAPKYVHKRYLHCKPKENKEQKRLDG
jgi:hypothetical protein